MDFFKRDMKERNAKDTKLVGAVVPTNVFYYLNLFCVVDERSKSSITRPLIEEWYQEAVNNFPEKELIKRAVEMGYKSWKMRKNRKRPFPVVLKQQERELRKKGVSEKVVLKIIKKIQAAKDKEISEIKIERIIKKNKKLKQQQHEKNNKDKE